MDISGNLPADVALRMHEANESRRPDREDEERIATEWLCRELIEGRKVKTINGHDWDLQSVLMDWLNFSRIGQYVVAKRIDDMRRDAL